MHISLEIIGKEIVHCTEQISLWHERNWEEIPRIHMYVYILYKYVNMFPYINMYK